MDIIIPSVIYVGDKILAQIIKDEVWSKRVKHFLFPPMTYKHRLTQIIYSTIDDFEKLHPYDHSKREYPFYHSKVFFEHLSLHILFDRDKLDSVDLDYSKNPEIIKPSRIDLEEFYAIFFRKVSADSVLKNKFVEENYKNRIFEISAKLDSIESKVDNIQLGVGEILDFTKDQKKKTPSLEIILSSLNKQVQKQLDKEINSGKYLRETFIETGNHKDQLRYLTDPVFYSIKCFEEIEMLDFRYLNGILKKKNHQEFNFDFQKFKPNLKTLRVNNVVVNTTEWINHLEKKRNEILEFKDVTQSISHHEYKIKRCIENLSFLKSRVALILETAGQGKTNFICDFIENFLFKRQIPTTFLTGSEINSIDIRKSFLEKIFPNQLRLSFNDLLFTLKTYCYEQSKFFIIVIDGINENPNSTTLSQNIESFLSDILEYDFIRVILSCRTEYYQNNFSNLEKSSFAPELIKITSLISLHPDDNFKNKLFKVYFDHFNITHRVISKKAYDQLVSNFLLLRIFCEAYQNQQLDRIDDIYKEELFEKYYTVKCNEINARLRTYPEFKHLLSFDIRIFLTKMVELMIANRTYVNVSLDSLVEDGKNRELYIRFLDENILVRKDLNTTEKKIFASSEVVNFTYDEFRDFLLSRYLITKLFIESESNFIAFLESEVSPKSPIHEGCSTFLFYVSRKNENDRLKTLISIQPWFESVFTKCIFSLPDVQVTAADRVILSKTIRSVGALNHLIITNLIYMRYNVEYYKNLNIDFLFEHLRTFNEDEYNKYFIKTFSYGTRSYNKVAQTELLENLEEVFETQDFDSKPAYHKVFELLIYMSTNDYSFDIRMIYHNYQYKYPKQSKEQLALAMECKNTKLKNEVIRYLKILKS